MRRRASLALIVVALLLRDGNPAVAQQTPIRPGETGHVTLTVSGTTKPLRIIVRNKTPNVVTVHGGDVQTVISSGGERNTITLEVTGVSVGEPSFAMEVDNTDLATVFRATLQKIAEDTRKRIEALAPVRIPSGRVVYKLADVIDVLQRITNNVHAALPDREFAPFRDAIDDYVVALQKRATERATVEPSLAAESRNTQVVLVSYRRVANVQGVEKEPADSIFREILALLDGTAEKGKTRELCVHTTPTRYEITLYPRSYPPDGQTVTAASLLTLTVGKYRYRIRAQGKNIESTGELDFLLNPLSAIDCPVKFTSGDPEACIWVEGAARPCE